MEVKGVAFISRRNMLISQFGEDKFNELMREVGEREPYFKNTDIIHFTMIPVEKFLFFNDAVLDKFYGGDVRVYWIMGEKSAEFALTEGPYKVLINNKDIERVFKDSVPILWKMYYTAGNVETFYTPGRLEARIFNLPLNHYYFEYVIMGYCNKLLELCGAKSISIEKIKTIDKGDQEIDYIFNFLL